MAVNKPAGSVIMPEVIPIESFSGYGQWYTLKRTKRFVVAP
jgi:hypothetical protein